jgi:Kef-type K+ transport system membrane component KefB
MDKGILSRLIEEFQLPLENPVLSFSLILLIILLSPILLRRLNIPGIIGLILSGVIIGPHGYHLIESNESVELFSTIGLLYIMFIAGLELDLNEFSAHQKKSFVFGFFTFAIPLLIGFPVCRYFLDYDFNASLLTASMFATHTLVAYPIVSKLGISKNPAVAIAVGGTILTDTAVLIILAVIVGNSQGNLDAAFWMTLIISLAIFGYIMFALIPKLARWFFRKLESEKHSHYIFVLAVVFFAAFLAEMAGVEPIIGAFMAGLALNRLIPHTSALMNRIEFMGNALFIPFFLISVGMLVDVRVILGGYGAWIVAGSLTAVALIGKWLAAKFAQWTFHYTNAQGQLIFGLSSAHAAATLAIILVGFRSGILDENILNGTIILILITCIVASFATEKAAKTILLAEHANQEGQAQTVDLVEERILIPIANPISLERMLELAILTKSKQTDYPITLLTVVENDGDAEANILRARNRLDPFVKQGSAAETKVVITTTLDFNPIGGIIRVARELFTTTVILGWPRKKGILDRLVGEQVDSVVSKLDKTILIVHLEKPFVGYTAIRMVAPPLSEKEVGFSEVFGKLNGLSKALNIPLVCYCNEATRHSIVAGLAKNKGGEPPAFEAIQEWDDFLIMSKDIGFNDLLVLISARKGSLSHMPFLDNLPEKLEKFFPDHARIIAFPQQGQYDHGTGETYEDFNGSTLDKGIQTVQKIGKGIGDIFKK